MKVEIKELLVVDDQAVTRFATKIVAEKLGYKVDETSSGPETIARLAEKQYQIILLDFDMAEMNGAQCADAIREMTNFDKRRTAIFGLSARFDPQTQRQCFEAGMDSFLIRPCTAENLTAAIEKWLFKLN